MAIARCAPSKTRDAHRDALHADHRPMAIIKSARVAINQLSRQHLKET
jgi:hypothetical protein